MLDTGSEKAYGPILESWYVDVIGSGDTRFVCTGVEEPSVMSTLTYVLKSSWERVDSGTQARR